jgi:hypothetical protein
VEAGAPLSDISRALYRRSRTPSSSCSARARRLESRTTAGSLVERDRCRLRATGADALHSEGIIDLLSQSDAAEVTILFKEAGPGDRSRVRTRPTASTRPS